MDDLYRKCGYCQNGRDPDGWKCIVCQGTGEIQVERPPNNVTEIVDRIIAELTDRRGFDAAWDETDADVREEIRTALADIILSAKEEG